MATKIEEVKKEGSRRAAAMRERWSREELQKSLIRKGTVFGTAAVLGTMNRLNVPIAIAGFPWKVAVAGVAMIVEATTKGPVQAVAGGIGDATMAVYIERSISTGSLIAGDDYVEYDGDDDAMRDDAAPADGGEL